jgi:uncharacterized protein (DUF1697 family)
MAEGRGINVGGKNIVPMKELVPLFTAAGCVDAVSYIQSGNVIFRAKAALARRVPALIAKAIEERFGIAVPVVVRASGELRRIAGENPFLAEGGDIASLHVVFLAEKPSAARVDALDPDRSPPDEMRVRGSEIYLRCPHGIGKTKLTNQYFDSMLSTTSTMRNMKTVLKLVELSRSGAR